VLRTNFVKFWDVMVIAKNVTLLAHQKKSACKTQITPAQDIAQIVLQHVQTQRPKFAFGTCLSKKQKHNVKSVPKNVEVRQEKTVHLQLIATKQCAKRVAVVLALVLVLALALALALALVAMVLGQAMELAQIVHLPSHPSSS